MADRVTLVLGAGTVSLAHAEVDRLLRSLRQVEAPGADSVAEEIAARTLTGHIELCPSEAELGALVEALGRLHIGARDQSGLLDLLDLLRGGRDVVEPVVRAFARGAGSPAR